MARFHVDTDAATGAITSRPYTAEEELAADIASDPDTIGQDRLNAALIEPGSVLRALVEVMRDEINILRTHAAIGLAARSGAQVKAALKAKMR